MTLPQKIRPSRELAGEWFYEWATNDEIKNISQAEYVAQQACAWALEQAAKVCDAEAAEDERYNNKYGMETAQVCATYIRARIQEPQK